MYVSLCLACFDIGIMLYVAYVLTHRDNGFAPQSSPPALTEPKIVARVGM